MKTLPRIALGLLLAFSLISLPQGSLPQMAQAASPRPVKLNTVHQEEMVYFNTHSFKYHKPNCEWALRCTHNCIMIPKSEAIRRGGISCRVCGG